MGQLLSFCSDPDESEKPEALSECCSQQDDENVDEIVEDMSSVDGNDKDSERLLVREEQARLELTMSTAGREMMAVRSTRANSGRPKIDSGSRLVTHATSRTFNAEAEDRFENENEEGEKSGDVNDEIECQLKDLMLSPNNSEHGSTTSPSISRKYTQIILRREGVTLEKQCMSRFVIECMEQVRESKSATRIPMNDEDWRQFAKGEVCITQNSDYSVEFVLSHENSKEETRVFLKEGLTVVEKDDKGNMFWKQKMESFWTHFRITFAYSDDNTLFYELLVEAVNAEPNKIYMKEHVDLKLFFQRRGSVKHPGYAAVFLGLNSKESPEWEFFVAVGNSEVKKRYARKKVPKDDIWEVTHSNVRLQILLLGGVAALLTASEEFQHRVMEGTESTISHACILTDGKDVELAFKDGKTRGILQPVLMSHICMAQVNQEARDFLEKHKVKLTFHNGTLKSVLRVLGQRISGSDWTEEKTQDTYRRFLNLEWDSGQSQEAHLSIDVAVINPLLLPANAFQLLNKILGGKELLHEVIHTHRVILVFLYNKDIGEAYAIHQSSQQKSEGLLYLAVVAPQRAVDVMRGKEVVIKQRTPMRGELHNSTPKVTLNYGEGELIRPSFFHKADINLSSNKSKKIHHKTFTVSDCWKAVDIKIFGRLKGSDFSKVFTNTIFQSVECLLCLTGGVAVLVVLASEDNTCGMQMDGKGYRRATIVLPKEPFNFQIYRQMRPDMEGHAIKISIALSKCDELGPSST